MPPALRTYYITVRGKLGGAAVLQLLCTNRPWMLVLQYKQSDGVAMGSPLGPALANIFVGYYKNSFKL